MDFEEQVLNRERVLWDAFINSEAFRVAKAKLLMAYNAFEKDTALDARETVDRTQLYMKRPKPPAVVKSMLLTLPERKRQAKRPGECMRMLSRPSYLMDRFAWYLMALCEEDDRWRFPPNDTDPLTDFERWAEREANDADIRSEIAVERKVTMAAARWFQSRCKAKNIPVDIEVGVSHVWWAYNGSHLSSVEVEYLQRDWIAAAEAALGVYVPLDPVGGVQKALILPDATPKEIARRYVRASAYV